MGGASSSPFESSNYAGQQGASTFESTQGGGGGGAGGAGGFASSYESTSYASPGDPNASGYQAYSTSTGGNFDVTNAAFNAADTNKDGLIDPNEFRQFIASQTH